jgi:DNA-binding GntR family transcriptional regulator
VSTDTVGVLRLPRATLASQVTERLRDSIVNGTLEPGSQLSEVELAASYGVSRGPVREAFQRLVQEGLLRSEPHRGVFVPVLTNEDVADVYLAREALESAAVRHVIATSAPETTHAALDASVAQMERAAAVGDWEAVGRSDLEFHTALVALTGSARLRRMFSTLISETRLCLGALTGAEARHDLVAEHRRICDWISDGDTAHALAALRQHFDDAVIALAGSEDGQGNDDPRPDDAGAATRVTHGR